MNEPNAIRRTLSVLVENSAGVLSQVSRLFSRKGYNIESRSCWRPSASWSWCVPAWWPWSAAPTPSAMRTRSRPSSTWARTSCKRPLEDFLRLYHAYHSFSPRCAIIGDKDPQHIIKECKVYG